MPALSLDPRLTAAARAHAEDMVAAGKIGHEGTDGSTPADRVRRVGYPYRRVGENVAAGWETVEAVTDGWMESPEHRRNILGDYAEMGAARAVDDDAATRTGASSSARRSRGSTRPMRPTSS